MLLCKNDTLSLTPLLWEYLGHRHHTCRLAQPAGPVHLTGSRWPRSRSFAVTAPPPDPVCTAHRKLIAADGCWSVTTQYTRICMRFACFLTACRIESSLPGRTLCWTAVRYYMHNSVPRPMSIWACRSRTSNRALALSAPAGHGAAARCGW